MFENCVILIRKTGISDMKVTVLLILFLLPVISLANPDYCTRLSVSQVESERFKIEIRNACDRKVYMNFCYETRYGTRNTSRGSAGAHDTDYTTFVGRSGDIRYKLGWSWNEARMYDCK